MRISTTQIFRNGIDTLQRSQQELNRTQLQLSTGKRILSPSDDPSGAVQSLQFRSGIEKIEQFQRNGTLLEQRLNYSETVLSSVIDGVQRVRELAVQGNNATQTNETRAFIAGEIQQSLDALLQLANTRDANGEYVFAGNKSLTKPFELAGGSVRFAGDTVQRSQQISPVRQIQAGESGQKVFMDIANGNGNFVVQDDAENQGTGVVSSTSFSGVWPDSGEFEIEFFRDFVTAGEDNTGSGFVSAANIEGDWPPDGPFRIVIAEATEDVSYRIIDANGQVLVGELEPELFDGPIVYTGDDGFKFHVTISGSLSEGDVFIVNEDGPLTYSIRDRDPDGAEPVVGQFRSGETIPYAGDGFDFEITIDGRPVPGDRFTLSEAGTQDLFTTYQQLRDALSTSVSNPADEARLNNAVNRALENLDNAIGNLMDARTRIGTGLQAVETQSRINEDQVLQLRATLSEIEDLDYAEAISRFNLQQTALQAAQQTYVQVQRLSLFNFL